MLTKFWKWFYTDCPAYYSIPTIALVVWMLVWSFA
jgi:hypothetical protein